MVSFINATLILSLGETVEEVTDSGILTTTPTLAVTQCGEDSLVQVYPQGIRHIRGDKRINEWKASPGKTVTFAACNRRQVVIAMSDSEIIYFELDASDQLNESPIRREMTEDVTSIAVGPIPEGRKRCKFLAVGCADSSVRLLSLDPQSILEPLSVQALTSPPHSLSMLEMLDAESNAHGIGTLFLSVGMQNGVYMRLVVDTVTG